MDDQNEQSNYDRIEAEYDDFTRDLARRYAGEHFDQLWSSSDAVFHFIGHPDPNLRAAAILCGSDKWGCGADSRFVELCCQIAVTDEDEPRGIAIIELGDIFLKTKKRPIQRILARIIRDEHSSNSDRNSAYYSLRKIEFGMEFEMILCRLQENQQILNGEYVDLVNIDWELVELIEASNESDVGRGL